MNFDLPNTPANINYSNWDINNNGVEQYDCIIVGGGLSGLYAANVLLENGVNNFLVLEARERLGGRTLTKKNSKVGWVDLGGSYVGPTQFYMQRMIKKLGLKTFKVNAQGENVYLNKKRRFLHECDGLPAMGSLVEMEVKYVLDLLSRMCKDIPQDAPWKALQSFTWDRTTFSQFLEKHCWTEEARQFLSLFMACCTSCEPYESSLLWTLWFIKQCDGLDVMFNIENCAQDSKIMDGTQQLSIKLGELIGGEERILTEKPVVQITRNESTSEEEENSWPVTVRTLDGATYHCRYLIMAIPLSTHSKIHYCPELPPLYTQMVQKIPMGSVIKCAVYYQEAFWRRDGLTGSMLINLAEEEGPISYTLDDSKPDGSYPAIVGFIIGDRYKAMLEKSKEERLLAICKSFAKALGSQEALKPIHYEEANWAEQYTGGCFTAFGIPGFLTTYGHLLRKPLFDDRIHLAGTETATYWSGYMDGAMQAGERAAIQVLQRLKIKVRPESILQRVHPQLLTRKKSLKAHAKQRRTSNTVTQIGMTVSINQLLTFSGILVALMGLIINASF